MILHPANLIPGELHQFDAGMRGIVYMIRPFPFLPWTIFHLDMDELYVTWRVTTPAALRHASSRATVFKSLGDDELDGVEWDWEEEDDEEVD